MIRGFDMPWMLACWECANTWRIGPFPLDPVFFEARGIAMEILVIEDDPVIGKAVQQGISELATSAPGLRTAGTDSNRR